MKLSNSDVDAMIKCIDSMANSENCPTALHAIAQPTTAKLWIVIKLADEAGVLPQIMKQIELD